MNATKERIGPEEAWELISQSSRLQVARGKKLLRFDLRDGSPSKEEILKVVMGPSGNLRAPSFRFEESFVVGFHEEGYTELIG